MIWADRAAKDIIASGQYKPYWVDDMKTPSGRIHVGSLRGVVMHDLLYKALEDAGQKATFSYVFDDHDPMDALPVYLDKKIWGSHLGKPLFTIPSPDPYADNYAQYFAREFQDVFHKIGCHPKIIWASQLYQSGKMNEAIRLCLDSVSTIRDIYEELYKKKMAPDWYPFQAVCPQCGKESTTKVTGWDGSRVTFRCHIDVLEWTKGCGFSGELSPFSSKRRYVGKLSWKVEWAVKWQIIGITIEGAGKDHMTAGGSHDVARLVCERVLRYPTPYAVAHEFFLVGGRKMSSSKGLGTSAKEVSEMLPPDLLRFLMVRTHINQAIDFDPRGMTIPDLFDEYDRCARAYFDKTDDDLARIFELSQLNKLPNEKPFLPRFRTLAGYVQMPNVNLKEVITREKGTPLTPFEETIVRERKAYAVKWLDHFAPQDMTFRITAKIPETIQNISSEQKDYLFNLSQKLSKKNYTADAVQQLIYETAKEHKLPTKDAFNAIYIVLLGKTFGPKAGTLIASISKDKIIERFHNVEASIDDSKL